MKSKKHSYLLIVIIFFVIGSSCKKNKVTPVQVQPIDSSAAAKAAKDSALLVTRDFYLWYDQIPSTFNAQNYADPNAVMVAIREAYSVEPVFNRPVDMWSFGVLKADWNQLSGGFGSVNNTVSTGDFGLSVFFFDKDGSLRVKLVERLSPAGLDGIQRGWKITKINGNTNMTAGNADFIVTNVYEMATSTFTFVKPDGTSVDITLNATTYPQQTVYLDTVYNVGSKAIGYMVLNSFLGDTSSIFSDFARVMNNFASQNVSDVVIDLRYNGGGYVSVQEKLADYLVPSSGNGSVMMKETFNDKHQDQNTILYFQKIGALNPSHILFIVTQSTASASELLINNLKPYYPNNEKIIGPGNTDGKPVGFFPIPVGDWYVFPVSFRSTNSVGTGGYFNGFTPDAKPTDGLDKNWGDPTETCLAEAIKYITTGAFRLQAPETYKEDPAVTAGNHLLDKTSFKGSVDTRGMK